MINDDKFEDFSRFVVGLSCIRMALRIFRKTIDDCGVNINPTGNERNNLNES